MVVDRCILVPRLVLRRRQDDNRFAASPGVRPPRNPKIIRNLKWALRFRFSETGGVFMSSPPRNWRSYGVARNFESHPQWAPAIANLGRKAGCMPISSMARYVGVGDPSCLGGMEQRKPWRQAWRWPTVLIAFLDELHDSDSLEASGRKLEPSALWGGLPNLQRRKGNEKPRPANEVLSTCEVRLRNSGCLD